MHNNIRDVSDKTCSNTNMNKYAIPFDYEEAQKSNILITGTNSTGKSRLACGIASILQNFDWKIVTFDPVGNYRKISDIPVFYRVRKARNYDPDSEEWFYPFPSSSMIFDMSLLIPNLQKSFVDDCLERIWNAQVRMSTRQWTLIALEEAQLFMRNIRGNVSQNLLRICSAGRNHKIRVLAVSVDLALIDPSFIRLCQQRFHGRLGIEGNAKRRFRDYYGIDWCRIATEGLDLGYFIYLLRDKLKIIHVPLFEAKRLPEAYPVPKLRIQPQPKGLLQKIRGLFK